MPEITAITPQKHDPTRCSISLDGRFFCGMKLETVAMHRLKTGMQVTEEELLALQRENEQREALDKALSHISAAGKTEKEVRDFLRRKGYLEEVVEDVVARMKEYGYIDDEAYAKSYAESAQKRKGSRLIALELKRKGVGEEAIAGAVEGADEEAAAQRVLEKYLRQKDLSDPKTVQKAYRHLLSKGFDYDTVRAALAAYAREEP